MPLSPGHRLGSYEIVSSLGAGGMGEVYRARDARLGREVALKVLPPEMTNEAGRLERFDREARAIAALNHPHIVTIYSTEDADGIRFLTMELVDGCTLSDLVVSSGMAVSRFLDIATPLADALAAAHQKQITHRDLKPGNVMVSNDGRVKVLDFGLARVGGGDHGEHSLIETLAPITHQGMIVGTMPYMSPEQVEGRVIDARSDLFSLGVIFYELLSGQRPFKGGSSPALMSAILRDAPPALRELRTDLPDGVDRLVGRLIEKRPEDRVQTARDVFNELKHVRKQVDSATGRASSSSGAAVAPPHNLWIAVLPFGVRGSDQDGIDLAAGLTEDIATSLARFPVFNVVAAQSTRGYKDSALDIRQIADRLGARYVIGGQVRHSARSIRVAAQLTDAASGAQLWSESYDRDPSKADLFAIQDDVTDHIVATVGDLNGVLARSMVKSVRSHLPAADQTSRELVLRAWGWQQFATAPEHADLRDAIEARVLTEKDNADLWAELAYLYIAEHMLVMNERPDPIGRATRSARRALEIDPHNQRGWTELAQASFFSRDRAAFLDAAERAVAINPRNAHCLSRIGNSLTHQGEYERGSTLTERAITINPRHPGWLHFALFNRHFAAGNYEEALRSAQRVNMPQLNWTFYCIATASAHLGLMDEARRAFDRMCEITPALAAPEARRRLTEMWHWQPEQVEALLEGLERAGAGVAADDGAGTVKGADVRSEARAKPPSSSAGTRGNLSVAVQSFDVRGSDSHARDLADGLREEIANGLSRFGYLRVLRGDKSAQARYSLEGQVRTTASSVRVTVKLSHLAGGDTLWSQNFDRPAGNDLFALQDDIANRVVTTVGDPSGVLARAMLASLADTPLDQLTVGELVIRYHAYTERFNAEEHALLREAFEKALGRELRAAEGWACLAQLYRHEYSHDYNPLPESLSRQRRAAARAAELDPSSQLAWVALASAHLFARDGAGVRAAVDRAVELNPLDAVALSLCALYLSCIGDHDRAVALAARTMALKPQYPSWVHIPAFAKHFVGGRHEEALHAAKAINLPRFAVGQIAGAAAAGLLGKADEARAALRTMQEHTPDRLDPERAREAWAKWVFDEAFLERMDQGYRKALQLAGLDLETGSRPDVDSVSGSKPPSSQARSAVTIAVKPFTARSAESLQPLADGISEDLATNLAKFSYLRVVARADAARFVIEGSARSAGTQVRITARLVDSTTSEHIWADTFDRDGADHLAIQDEIAARIGATVADEDGVLVHAITAPLLEQPADALTIDELVLRFYVYTEQMNRDENAQLMRTLEQRLASNPSHAGGWAALSTLYGQAVIFGFDSAPADAVDRQARAADRAVALDAKNQFGWFAMALKATLARDLVGLREASARSVAINPLSGNSCVSCAAFLAFAGDVDRAQDIYLGCKRLIPNHQDWYYVVPMLHAFKHRRYDEMLQHANRVVTRSSFVISLTAAAAAAELGRADEARAALDAVKRVRPDLLSLETARLYWRAWFWDEADVEQRVNGLRKALALVDTPAAGVTATPPASTSGTRSTTSAARTAVTIAVKPFTARSAESLQPLADGICEDLGTNLAKFSYLRVVARADAARFVLEGSARSAGTQVRVTARLVDSTTSEHIWAETFDRDAADQLAIQDEVAARIAATVADEDGVLVHAVTEPLIARPFDELSIDELILRFYIYTEQFEPGENRGLTQALERQLEAMPSHSGGWGVLSALYAQAVMFGMGELPADAVARQARAAERAVALDAKNQYGWFAMALRATFARDLAALRDACARTVAINPLSGNSCVSAAVFLSMAGDSDQAMTIYESCRRLIPHHQDWYHCVPMLHAYKVGRFEEAWQHANMVSMRAAFSAQLVAAASAGMLGRVADARTALDAVKRTRAELLDLGAARLYWSGWNWSEDEVDRLIDGLRKAIALVEAPAAAKPPSSAAAAGKSIAVLPFTDLSERKDQDWFCDGIAEEIMNALAPLPGLRVAARASSFSFRGKTDDLRAIGDKLNVRTVLEGSVRRAGDRVRITAQLSDAPLGQVLWSERFDRDLKDIFDVQDEIAHAIVDRLRVTIGDTTRIVEKRTSNMEAYELLLKGRTFVTRRGRAVLDAIPLFERAIALDPNLSEAHALLGDSYRLLGLYGVARASEVMPKARACVDRALAVDPNSAEALACLAIIATIYEWDLKELRRRSAEALAADPNHVRANAERGISLAVIGLPAGGWEDDSLRHVRKARALDPLNAWVAAIEAACLMYTGHLPEAVEAARVAVEIDHDNFTAHWIRVMTLSEAGREDDALEAAVPALAMSGRHTMILSNMTAIYAERGEIEKSEAIHQELSERAQKTYISEGARALAAAAAGRFEEARALLREAIAIHDPWVAFWKLYAWRPIWKDEQCAAMLKATSLFDPQ